MTNQVLSEQEPLKTSDTCGRMGWALYHQGKYAEAIEAFNEAINLDPSNPYFRRGRGWAYSQSREYKNAILDLSLALAKTDRSQDVDAWEEALRGLGWSLYHQGVTDSDRSSVEQALEKFGQLLTEGIQEPRRLQEACRGMGWACYRLGRFPETKEYFSKALE